MFVQEPTTQLMLPHPRHNSASAFVLVLINSDNGRVGSHRRVSWIIKCCRPLSLITPGAGELRGVSPVWVVVTRTHRGENSQLWGRHRRERQESVSCDVNHGEMQTGSILNPLRCEWILLFVHREIVDFWLSSNVSSVEISWMKNSLPSWENKL